MTCRVVLIESEESFAVFCPALPGCVSQGATEIEALDNIREAAALWLDAGGTVSADDGSAREVELLREAAADSLTARVREVGLTVAA
jgi:predicted RNase H-like HicB family nuclease